MPLYTYRREDGTTFDYRQKFTDEALKVDPVTGQRVVRVVQAAGIVFKGSGFYVNDSKDASRKSINTTAKTNGASEPVKEAAKETTPAKSDAAAAAD